MSLVTVDEAADRLDLSARQVQRLARAGDLVLVGPNRIDWESVLRHEAARKGHHRRAWTEPTAWAAVALLAGAEVTWLGQAQRSRLKGQLKVGTAEEVVARTRNRATVHRLSGHRSVVGRLAADVVGTGSDSAIGELTAAGAERVDGYVSAERYDTLMTRYRLSEAGADGNVTLRVTRLDLKVVASIADHGQVLAGLDLGSSLDARERSAGLSIVTQALERIR